MPFPAITVSAQNIRDELAYNNTAGAQTSVSLNDQAVRVVANKPSGPISYADLRSKNVIYSATMFVGFVQYSSFGSTFDEYGYNAPGGTRPIGIIYTTSYFRNAVPLGGGVPSVTLVDAFARFAYLTSQWAGQVDFNGNVQGLANTTLTVCCNYDRYTTANPGFQNLIFGLGNWLPMQNYNGQTITFIVMGP